MRKVNEPISYKSTTRRLQDRNLKKMADNREATIPFAARKKSSDHFIFEPEYQESFTACVKKGYLRHVSLKEQLLTELLTVSFSSIEDGQNTQRYRRSKFVAFGHHFFPTT